MFGLAIEGRIKERDAQRLTLIRRLGLWGVSVSNQPCNPETDKLVWLGGNRVGAFASTEAEDSEGEVVLTSGVEDLPKFLAQGWINMDHRPGVEYVVGIPRAVRHLTMDAPNGVIPTGTGLWLEFDVADNDLGRSVLAVAKQTRTVLGLGEPDPGEQLIDQNQRVLA
jgi:hypothetical protein